MTKGTAKTKRTKRSSRRATNAPFKPDDRWMIRFREVDGTHRRKSFRT